MVLAPTGRSAAAESTCGRALVSASAVECLTLAPFMVLPQAATSLSKVVIVDSVFRVFFCFLCQDQRNLSASNKDLLHLPTGWVWCLWVFTVLDGFNQRSLYESDILSMLSFPEFSGHAGADSFDDADILWW